MTRNSRSRTVATARSMRAKISQAIVTVELIVRQPTSAAPNRPCNARQDSMLTGPEHIANSKSRVDRHLLSAVDLRS